MNRAFALPTVKLQRQRQPSLVEIQGLIDHFPQAALVIDLRQQRILLANAPAAEMTCFTRNELAQLSLAELAPVLSQQNLPAELKGTSFSIFASLATRQGAKLEVFATLSRLDSRGDWALLLAEPASAYYQRKANLDRQTQRLHDLHDLALVFQEGDTDTAVRAVLKIAKRMTGAPILAIYLIPASKPGLEKTFSLEQGGSLPDFIPAAEVQGLLATTQWIPGKRASTSLHKKARSSDWSFLATTPLGQPGALLGILAVGMVEAGIEEDFPSLLNILAATFTSIFQQKILRANLLNEENRKARLLLIGDMIRETNQEGILLLAPNLVIEELNAAAETMLGYATSEVCGQPLSSVLIGADNLVPALQAAQQNIPTPTLGNVHLHHRDGTAFPALVRVLPLSLEDRFEGVLVLIRDLSEHEQNEVRNQQLEQRALLGEVTAIFAHEVRNPINNITSGLQLLEYTLPPDDPNREVINRLNQDCNRLAHLMDSVLAFSRPAESKMEPIDLAQLLPGLLERWRPRLTRLNIRQTFKANGSKTTIEGDMRSLEQVFNNLIGNAAGAMSQIGGSLVIQLRPAPLSGTIEQVEVSVADDGPGIPQENLKRIFEPFFTTNRNGTGLGLSIAKRIITAHKGTVDVSSVPGGTVFRVVFPLARS